MTQLRARGRAVVGQQHQPRAPAAADGVLRGFEPAACGASMASRRRTSFPAATSATRSHASGREGWACRSPSIELAHNANRTVPDYLAVGRLAARDRASRRWPPRWTSEIRAISSAYSSLYPDISSMRDAVTADAVDDDGDPRAHPRRLRGVRPDLVSAHRSCRRSLCAPAAPRRRTMERWVLVATAHPAKFREIVEPLIGARGGGAADTGRAVRPARGVH